MDNEQIIIGIVLIVVFLGLIRFLTRIVLFGLMLFVGAPFLLSGPVAGVDWSGALGGAADRVGRFIEIMGERAHFEDASGVRVTITEGDSRCPAETPLRLGIWNDAEMDLGYVTYRLKYRPVDRSTETTFHKGRSDYIVKPGKSLGSCIERPEEAPVGAVFRGDIHDVDFMPAES